MQSSRIIEKILATPLPEPPPLRPVSAAGVILYGAGKMGEMALDCMERTDLHPEYFVDAHGDGRTIRGIPVIHPDAIPDADKESLTFVVCIATIPYEPIRTALLERGCRDVRHFYDYSEITFPEIMPNGWLVDSPDQELLTRVHEALAHDALSAAHFEQFLWWRVARREVIAPHHPVLTGRKYFGAPCVPAPKDKEFLVDCGVHEGQSIRGFLDYAGQAFGGVLGFEPDPGMCQIARAKFDHPDITILDKAVFARSGTMAFRSNMDFASTLADNGDLHVATACLDDMPEVPATFLKLHVEGAELSVLKGSREFIQQHRPVVMVLADHNSDGLQGIPEFLLELERYTLYFYLHDYCGNSGVYYAVPEERKTYR
ncbi:FkbM family methyltransferase [Desulfovibrio caledoniensis]